MIGHHKTDMSQGMVVLPSVDPQGIASQMWALFAVYQTTHVLISVAVDVTGIRPDKINFSHALAAATDTVTAGSGDEETAGSALTVHARREREQEVGHALDIVDLPRADNPHPPWCQSAIPGPGWEGNGGCRPGRRRRARTQ